MDSLFGRKKRTRQSGGSNPDLNIEKSVPYHKLGPSPRTPIPVGTTNQGLRANANSVISAPITNPTLTSNGTELNVFHRRDRAYSNAPRSVSPGHSAATSESTLYTDKYRSNHNSKFSISDASTTSSGRSPSVTDFGNYGANSQTVRPSSRNASRSDNRISQYAHSLAGSESLAHYSTHLSSQLHLHRHGSGEEFYFPRPEHDDEIEALFENIRRMRDLAPMPGLSVEQKWNMVYSDEHIRWKEDKQREEQAKKQGESGQPASIVEGTPEWYIKKFLDQTITPKQLSSLEVSLRSKELRCASIPPLISPMIHLGLQLVSPLRIYPRYLCAGTNSNPP